jgi:phosphopentomutase
MAKGISFIISDFFSEDGYEEAIKLLQYKRQQIVLIHVLSPEEINPTIRGNFRLVDSESGKAKDIELTQEKINNYKKALENFKNQLQSFCTKRGQQYIMLSTDLPILLGLENCLRR